MVGLKLSVFQVTGANELQVFKKKKLVKGFQSRTEVQQQTFPKAEPEIELLSTPVTEYTNEGSILETTAISIT